MMLFFLSEVPVSGFGKQPMRFRHSPSSTGDSAGLISQISCTITMRWFFRIIRLSWSFMKGTMTLHPGKPMTRSLKITLNL